RRCEEPRGRVIQRATSRGQPVGLTNRAESFLRALAKLFHGCARLSLSRDDAHGNALRLGREPYKLDPVVECIIERVRGEGDADPGADCGKNAGPTIMLLHHARLIGYAGE